MSHGSIFIVRIPSIADFSERPLKVLIKFWRTSHCTDIFTTQWDQPWQRPLVLFTISCWTFICHFSGNSGITMIGAKTCLVVNWLLTCFLSSGANLFHFHIVLFPFYWEKNLLGSGKVKCKCAGLQWILLRNGQAWRNCWDSICLLWEEGALGTRVLKPEPNALNPLRVNPVTAISRNVKIEIPVKKSFGESFTPQRQTTNAFFRIFF